MHHDIAIIGAGLSGLYAARLLQQAGVDYVVLEAAPRTGGRILSLGTDGDRGPCDLGPSWYWPAFQPRMPQLVRELGLRVFPQANSGALVWEESPTQCTQFPAGAPDDGSMRIDGGTASLIDALEREVPAERVLLNHRVTTLRRGDGGVEVDVHTGADAPITCTAQVVISALPLRLLAESVVFDPPLPDSVRDNWRDVPTWMAGNAKFIALYERPFWRDAGLSGEGRSQVGPLVEIHDASDDHGTAALTAFVGTPAEVRAADGMDLRAAAVAQLARMFGDEAATPIACLWKDWARDSLVATPEDVRPLYAHPSYGGHAPLPDEWASCMVLAGTETARGYGGYMEGALEAAEAAVGSVLSSRYR